MPSSAPKVAFAGLGAMGYGMASHLVKSGFHVTGFDVYQPTLDRFIVENSDASAAKTPREAVQDADFLIVMVATSVQATPLLFDQTTGAVNGMKDGATVVMCSTVSPAYIAEVQSLLQKHGRQDIRLIDSPVSGGAGRAAAGTLSIFASASDPQHLSDARAILQCMSDDKKLYEIPGGLGGGSNAKLIHQIFAGVHIAMSSEAMGLAALAGWDTKEAFEKLSGGECSSWMFENRVPPMFDPGHQKYSAITIITKDVVGSALVYPVLYRLALSGDLLDVVMGAHERPCIGHHHLHRPRAQLPSSPPLHRRTALPHRHLRRMERRRRLRSRSPLPSFTT